MKKLLKNIKFLLVCLITCVSLAPTVFANESESIDPFQLPKDLRLLNEQLEEQASYPYLTLDQDKTVIQDLNQAMNKYYEEELSDQEKSASQEELVPENLEKILTIVNKESDLSQLNLAIDQVTMTVAGDEVQVPRLILPQSYRYCENLANNHDARLINHALSVLGNRLIVIAYYDPASEELVPLHLVCNTHSIYYNEALTQDDVSIE